MKTWQILKQNPELFSRYFVKEYIIKAARKYFEAKNYHELESPILSSALPSERYLDVLTTQIDFADGSAKEAYLIPSTETFNKRVLAAGLGNHFVITKVFRGLEAIGPNHSPEFTMLEWYNMGANYKQLMSDCEELIIEMKKMIDFKNNREFKPQLEYQGTLIDLSGNWPRMSVEDALVNYANLSLREIQTIDQIKAVAISKGYRIEETDDWETLFELIFLNEVEPNFPKNKPIFIYDYPKILCPLTKSKDGNPLVCEKVELYIAGKEIANGYTELLDGNEQEQRLKIEFEARKALKKKEIAFDHDLVSALKSGIEPVAGIGMGLDRLAMIFANASNISEINFFPATELFE